MLWRHGQTVWNAERRFQGQSDIPLDETGQAQADRAARLLAGLRPDLIVSSDLSRAASTAAALARLTGLEVTLDKDLRERPRRLLGGADRHRDPRPLPGRARVLEPAGRRAEPPWSPNGWPARCSASPRPVREPGMTSGLAVVVSHGAALRLGMSRLLGMPDELFGVLGPLSNCSWSVLGRRSGRWRLLEHNAGTLPEPILSDDR